MSGKFDRSVARVAALAATLLIWPALAKALPDVTVSGVSISPQTANAGDYVYVNYRVSATGATGTLYPWVKVFLSTDAVITTSDLGLSAVQHTVPLNQTVDGSQLIVIPANQPSGVYYLGVYVDYANYIAESDESNNGVVVAQIPINYVFPDFAITDIHGDAAAAAGGGATVTFTVSSAANGAASQTPGVSLVLSDDATITTADSLIGGASVTLAAGQSQTITMPVTIPGNRRTGTYYLGANVNPYRSIAETAIANNTMAYPIAITYWPADFSIGSVAGPVVAAPGQSIPVTFTAVSAAGASETLTPFIGIYLSNDAAITTSDLIIGQGGVTMSPGQSRTLTFPAFLPGNQAPGVYHLGAIVDFGNGISETNEGNNASLGNEIVIGPDLRVTQLDAPLVAAPGASISVTDTILNAGSAAGTSTVGFYLSADKKFDGTDRLIGTRSVGPLAEGISSSATTSISVPADVSGAWHLLAVADSTAQVAEADETNNTGTPASLLIAKAPQCTVGMAPLPTSNPCVVKVCDSVLGLKDQWLPAGTSCSDASACNGLETCNGAGVCLPGTPLVADDGSACTLDYCSDSIGVYHVTLPGCGAPPSSSGPYEMSFSYDATGNMVGVVNLSSDVNNCGALGAICGATGGGTAQCLQGRCWLGTATGYVDLQSDVTNCGTVGNVCQGRVNGYPECSAGNCGVRCLPGFASSGGVCVDVGSDPANCGAVGNACVTPTGGVAVCTHGLCGVACAYPFAKVAGSCVDLMTTPDHCGVPYHTCETPAHGAAACTLGVCDVACPAPFTRQGAVCVDLESDPYNCGILGNVCDHAADGSGVCRAKQCVVVLGAPAVISVNGVGAPSRLFRIRADGGLTLIGDNLSRVIRVEFEVGLADWTRPDPLSSWYIPSEPLFSGSVTPDPSGSAGISFTVGAASLSVTGQELATRLSNWALSPWTWYRIRLHYLNEGLDQVSVVDVPFSFIGLEQVNLPAPQITGIDVVRALTSPSAWGSDPVVVGLGPEVPRDGLLWVDFRGTGTSALPASFISNDWASEYPVIEVLYQDSDYALVRIAAGLNLNTLFHDHAGSEVRDRLMAVIPYVDDRPVVVADGQEGVLIRGTNLGLGAGGPFPPDGPVYLANSAGRILPGIVEGYAFPDHIVVPPGNVHGIADAASFIVFQSARGSTKTPLPVNWADAPRVSSLSCSTADCWAAVPYDQVMQLDGLWLNRISGLAFCGPSASGTGPACEALTQLTDPGATPAVGQYVIVGPNRVRMNIGSAVNVVSRAPLPEWVGGVYVGGERSPGVRWIQWSYPGTAGKSAGEWYLLPEGAPSIGAMYASSLNNLSKPWLWWYQGSIDRYQDREALLTIQGFDARFHVASVTLYPYFGTEATSLQRDVGFLVSDASSVVITRAGVAAAMARHALRPSDGKCHDFGARIVLQSGAVVTSGVPIKYCDTGLPAPEPDPISPGTGITVKPNFLPGYSTGGCSNSICY